MTPCRARSRCLALSALLLLAAVPAAPRQVLAQLPPLTVPKGQFRLDFAGEFRNYDQRFIHGTRQDLAADFVRDAIGSDFFPALGPSEDRVARIIASMFRFDLGKTSATSLVNVGTFNIGLALGITSRLTLFGTVPIVRVRVQPTLALDGADANAGFNPADPIFGSPTGQAQAALFFGQLGLALDTLAARIQSGFYDATNLPLAQQTLANGQVLQADLQALLTDPTTAATFLPLAASTGGLALTGVITGLQATITSTLGIAGFSVLPALPTETLTTGDFESFVTAAGGPIAGFPLSPVPLLARIGDIEVGASYLLVDRRPGPQGGLGFRFAGQGIVRLRTGIRDSPHRFFDVSTGDRQPDVDLSGVADFYGKGIGLRLSGGYVLQLAASQQRRVSPPDQPIPSADRLANVRWDPGDEIVLRASPFVRMAAGLVLHAGFLYRHHAEDAYSYLDDSDISVLPAASVLGQESAWSTSTLVAGMSFAHNGVDRRGNTKLPMDAYLEIERILSATGGRVADARVVRAGLRLYGRAPF